jgi:dTDP-4-dehydrorhamnose reductase
MRVAVVGANGQLGRDLMPRLGGEVVPLSRADLDLEKSESISATLRELKPDVVVNTAAFNLVDVAETAPDAAFRVNAWGVRELAKECDALDARLVHFSTDYVFGLDAGRTTPLTETDPPGPLSVYGLSKLAGEYVVRTFARRHLVIRTCGLYGVWGSGGKGTNFVETILRLAGQGKPLRVVADQWCTPTYTADLADATAALINRGATGLIHVTNAGSVTWYEFAAAIFRAAGVSADLAPTTTAGYGAPALRPPYSVLGCNRLAEFGVTMRLWPDALADYLKERTKTKANRG